MGLLGSDNAPRLGQRREHVGRGGRAVVGDRNLRDASREHGCLRHAVVESPVPEASVSGGKVQTVAGPLANAGSLRIGSGSRVDLTTGDFTQTLGTTNLIGTTAELRVIGAANKAIVNGGTLVGPEPCTRPRFATTRHSRPAWPPRGVLTADGRVRPTRGGHDSHPQLNGTAPGSGHDQVAATGAATIDGTLTLHNRLRAQCRQQLHGRHGRVRAAATSRP